MVSDATDFMGSYLGRKVAAALLRRVELRAIDDADEACDLRIRCLPFRLGAAELRTVRRCGGRRLRPRLGLAGGAEVDDLGHGQRQAAPPNVSQPA